MADFIIPVPREFSAQRCFEFLQRSPRELLHRVEGDRVVKLLRIENELILFSVTPVDQGLNLELLNGTFNLLTRQHLNSFVRAWFDLDTNLKPFYTLAKKDPLLKDAVKRYSGYRIVGQPDLFESLVWAVLGQQINLSFAYLLKQRMVEKYGAQLMYCGQPYFAFPTPQELAMVQPEDLLALQFSRQKAAYTIGIAQSFAEGKISTQSVAALPFGEAKEALMKVKGIGNWTANYALMKTFRYAEAFPLEDAGLHNAIRNILGMKAKPDLKKVTKIFRSYKGWEAYATLYLWKSLEEMEYFAGRGKG